MDYWQSAARWPRGDGRVRAVGGGAPSAPAPWSQAPGLCCGALAAPFIANLRYAFQTPISRAAATFSRTPSGVSESFIVQVDAYGNTDGSYLGSVLCHTEDTGSATLPSAGFQNIPNGSLLAISLLRMEFSSEVNPNTGHTIQGAAQLGLVGTGRLGN